MSGYRLSLLSHAAYATVSRLVFGDQMSIIAAGGLRTPGQMLKALALGADADLRRDSGRAGAGIRADE
ncbi:MAG: glutamate synthase-related protein [Limnochordia bacterium]